MCVLPRTPRARACQFPESSKQCSRQGSSVFGHQLRYLGLQCCLALELSLINLLTGEPILPAQTANQHLARCWFAVCAGKIGCPVSIGPDRGWGRSHRRSIHATLARIGSPVRRFITLLHLIVPMPISHQCQLLFQYRARAA